MSELLRAVFERLPARVRRLVVTGGAMLALVAVIAALMLTSPRGDRQRQQVRHRHSAVRVQRTAPQTLAPPISTEATVRARRVAEQVLAGYLPFAYGRRGPLAISGITSALRYELLHKRAELTPVERRRRPRVASLQTTATTPTFVVATAVIDDDGMTTYRLRFELEGRAGRWLVSGVQEG